MVSGFESSDRRGLRRFSFEYFAYAGSLLVLFFVDKFGQSLLKLLYSEVLGTGSAL